MARKLAHVTLLVSVVFGLASMAGAADSENPLRHQDAAAVVCTSGTESTVAAGSGTANAIIGNTVAANADTADTTPAASQPQGEAESYGEACCCWTPQWTAEGGALFMWRAGRGGPPLLSDPVAGTLFNSSDPSFSCEAGPQISIMRNGCDWDLEFKYFGIDGWDADANFPNSALPNGVAILALDKAIPLPVTAVSFAETSRLYSSELNLRRTIRPWLTLLAGLRWVELEDGYAARGTEAVLSTPFAETIRAHNHLIGAQSGVDALLWKDSEYFQIRGFAKSGLFYNDASQDATFSNPAGLGTFSASAGGGHASYLCEMGIIASQQLTKNAVLRGGYELLYLDGLALAPRQIPNTDLAAGTASLDAGGGLLFHGINLSLEVTW